MDTVSISFLSGILILSALIDFRRQKIPNLITLPSMVIAISYHVAIGGIDGLLFSLAGLAVGIFVFLVPYLMGGMGAGDAKLMGVVGALIGAKGVIFAFLCTAIIGGIYALVLILVNRAYFDSFFKKQLTTLKTFILTRQFTLEPIQNGQKRPRLCYGIAIAIGTGLYMFLNQSGYVNFS
jgi:prepilin peptidase CpaA